MNAAGKAAPASDSFASALAGSATAESERTRGATQRQVRAVRGPGALATAAELAPGPRAANQALAESATYHAVKGCFHCGLPVARDARWKVAIGGAERAMCCPGCAAVAEAIVGAGQDDYYLNRDGYAATATDAQLVPPELALYDNADARFACNDTDREAILLVEGIRCAACVWLIERRLLRLPGVLQASMNVATERLRVRWREDACHPAAILAALRGIGYTAWPYDAARHSRQLQQAGRTLGRQLFVAGLSMMQVMMYVAPAYLADDGTLDANMEALMRWASLLLTLPAVCYSAQPFFRGAWASLRARAPGMDVPVALGIGAAFIASCAATWTASGEVYFDSVTMFIFLLLCSRYLELAARRKAATALERMRHGLPASAARMRGWPADRACDTVPAAALRPGDLILVKPGEAIAADGTIVEGETSVDLSLLTGESAPQRRAEGDSVPGGAINASAAVVLRVASAAGDSTLAGLLKLIERAGREKPRIAQWADRVASVFVAALLLFALAAFAWWHWHDAARAWPVAIAVLVVSCPCALSLATPSALAAATDGLLGRGVMIVRPHVLETLHRATHVVFDKTGTLTEGKPAVQAIDTLGAVASGAALRIAAALEAGSAHPIGRAITEAASLAGGFSRWQAEQVRELPGQGLEGVVFGRRYRLGSAAFVAGIAGAPAAEPHDLDPRLRGDDGGARAGIGGTPVYLGGDAGWIARFMLSDAVRADALATVDWFRAHGKQVLLLSGDEQALTLRVARGLGIAHAMGGQLPEHKLAHVRRLQREGAIVAMVGDGINDAAVLGGADVSFAMGGGAAIAQAHADAVLLNGRLGAVADTARAAARTMRVIRQNLAWATLYNAVAIPAAALGYLNPWLSGAGMALSSAVVVLNALRLRGA
ncbi:heavy metal translocating P-type ATPase [Pseudoduganella namucuonensis]|uniref:Cu2+-exporting ATPase n=1 Tax=Pseudoduganella namucuonensis TaxID=1035707 RepID=A0A1I7G5P9_9BURK|nr:heavy metal translocating P-type ATPase [Pseudoduganella namucuonensis]SFU43759.1 Cu2+-exporting ATPase [Pseudoduganella namucuonensis]